MYVYFTVVKFLKIVYSIFFFKNSFIYLGRPEQLVGF